MPIGTKYEGWSNYPTWAVNLWIKNEYPIYKSVQRMIQAAKDDPKPLDWLTQALEQFTMGMKPEISLRNFADIMDWALGEVDWEEIAENYIEEF